MNSKLWSECFNSEIVPIHQALGAMDKYCTFLEQRLIEERVQKKLAEAPVMPALEKVGSRLREPGGFISNADIDGICDKLMAAADGLYNTNRLRSLEIRAVALRLCGFKHTEKPVDDTMTTVNGKAFTCPKCASNVIEEVWVGVHKFEAIKNIGVDGVAIYHDKSAVTGGGGFERFECKRCGLLLGTCIEDLIKTYGGN